jgi:CRP-like cAMP-binding protein
MSVVFLIFVGLVIYWTVSDRRAARVATPAVALARTTTPTTPAPSFMTLQGSASATERTLTHTFWADYLTDHDREALLATAVLRTYRAGDVIFHEGDDAHAFCLLLSGRVGLLTNVGQGRHLLAGTMSPGRLFAWSGLVGDHHYTATVHVILDCDVAIFQADAVRRLCTADPALGYHLMNEVAADIAERVHERDERFGTLVPV